MELGYYTETGEAKLSNFISCIFFLPAAPKNTYL